MIVVIPTSRRIDLHYLTPLIDAGARFFIIDDTSGCVRLDHPQFSVFNWGDQRRVLGSLERAIPRGTGASRDFGFLLAWKESADDEIIVALDDDCVVEDPGFADQVVTSLTTGPAVVASGTGDFFNIFDLYEALDSRRVFPRGFPYSARGDYQPWQFEAGARDPVAFNLGLWSGILDVNAVDKLRLPSYQVDQVRLRVPGAVVPPGPLLCLCSMNMQFRRWLVPAVYQLPMHVEVLPDWVIDRYGDIWGGFILKVLMDLRGDRLSVGGPLIRHLKAGTIERNLWQEHLSHLVNDEFIALLHSIRERLAAGAYIDMMSQVRDAIVTLAPACSPILRAYLARLDDGLSAWVEALGGRL